MIWLSSSTTRADVTVSTLTFVGEIPEGAGAATVTVDGKSVSVGADRTFEAEVSVPAGSTSVSFDVVASYGGKDHTRHVTMKVEDRGPPITGLDVSAAELRSFLGGPGILVWVDAGGQIRVLDLRAATPQVSLLSGDVSLINPRISPDGTRVVYSQGSPEGTKQILVRSLAGGDAQTVSSGDIGYWYFGNGGEYVIYSDWSPKAENGAGRNTYRQQLVTGGIALSGSRTTIHNRAMDAGSNATLTWLGQVYESPYAYNMETATEYPPSKFFLMDGDVAAQQTCNGSMAPDGSSRIMLLVIPHDWVRIFSYKAAGDRFEETSRFSLPSRLSEWEFPEWSTHPGYFTAVFRSGGLNLRLYVAKIVEGQRVPEMLAVTSWDTSVSFSHLYVGP